MKHQPWAGFPIEILAAIVSAAIYASVIFAAGRAFAAELPAVDPPGNCWIGLAVAAVVVIGIVLLIGYIVHIKRTAGNQPGEEAINKLLNMIEKKDATIASMQTPTYSVNVMPGASPQSAKQPPQPPAKFPADWN